jgi:hypothetical protein
MIARLLTRRLSTTQVGNNSFVLMRVGCLSIVTALVFAMVGQGALLVLAGVLMLLGCFMLAIALDRFVRLEPEEHASPTVYDAHHAA